ncbi:hypothetical protein BpHYR1_036314 [Brachionus plicatilis]|uniref:Uncharacterized protein n=1 Tax=Brachionus plicatilis TaxID=10195 RepID=A0A3M7SLV3_BRAPC|nr:hypothetical protein BpHYR1_036314 [Brachionus plicatilis]
MTALLRRFAFRGNVFFVSPNSENLDIEKKKITEEFFNFFCEDKEFILSFFINRIKLMRQTFYDQYEI